MGGPRCPTPRVPAENKHDFVSDEFLSPQSKDEKPAPCKVASLKKQSGTEMLFFITV